MTKHLKKPEFLLPLARLFTRAVEDPYESIPFQSSDSFGDESSPALASPTIWSAEAVSVMAEAACKTVPADLRSLEENTVPSWLWRHQSRGTRREVESDLRDIFNRIVGAAVAKAWKLSLFTSEKHARAFYDETRYALMQRHIAIAPDVIAPWGLGWAYGIKDEEKHSTKKPLPHTQSLSNTAIDAVVGKNADATLWKKLFTTRSKDVAIVDLRLSDIAADWHSTTPNPARAVIDVMALRHNDGSVNSDALRQTARLLTILLDLQDRNDVTIGLANLAPLLMALGLAYDSDAARALAASLAALVTAECVAASAEMAALRGASKEFSTDREAIMRSLRNHRRAVYGDSNDYEKLSVLPAPLSLKNCPDLSLVAAAQRRWDEALVAAQAFGLRATQATDLTPSPVLTLLTSCASQGLEPIASLMILQSDENASYHTLLHPAVGEALTRLDYPRSAIHAAAQHIVGTRSLRKAPVINHATLKAQGLSEAAIEKIESYLPCVDTIRLAITPWVIGDDAFQPLSKIAAFNRKFLSFSLTDSFSDAEIESADLYCYGHNTLRNAKIVHLRHRSLFACGTEISAEARLRMAAAVQSFISGDTGMTAFLPATQSVACGAEMALAAWQRGLKSLTLVFDPAIEARPVHEASTVRRIKAASHAHAKPFTTPPRRTQSGKNAPVVATKKAAAVRRVAR